MDVDTIKLLLSTQDQAYRGALEMMMKQVFEEIGSLRSTADEMRRSLEFTQAQVDDFKNKIKKLEKEKEDDKTTINELKKKCQAAGESIDVLDDRCDYLEDYSRRNNVNITGMEERPGGETWEQTAEQVMKLFDKKMHLQNLSLERAHRVGQRMDQRPRPVVARFLRYSDRDLVMRNATKLRGTKIYINDDLCPASQDKRRQQLPLLQRARSEGKIAYFRHTKLVIREREGLGAASSRAPVASEVGGQRLESSVVEGRLGSSSGMPDAERPAMTVPAAGADAAPSGGSGMGRTQKDSKMTLRSGNSK